MLMLKIGLEVLINEYNKINLNEMRGKICKMMDFSMLVNTVIMSLMMKLRRWTMDSQMNSMDDDNNDDD